MEEFVKGAKGSGLLLGAVGAEVGGWTPVVEHVGQELGELLGEAVGGNDGPGKAEFISPGLSDISVSKRPIWLADAIGRWLVDVR